MSTGPSAPAGAGVLPTAAAGAERRAVGLGFLLVTAFGWGINWPMMRLVLGELPPLTARALSGFVGALVAFAAAALLRERLRPPAGQWGTLLISTTLNFSAFSGLSILCVKLLDASEAVIVVYTLPLWAVLLAWPLLGERPTPARIAALVIGLSGVVVLMSGQLHFDQGWTTLAGVLCGLGASILFALGTVLTKRRPLAMPQLAAVAWQIGLGTIPLAALSLTEEPHWSGLTPGVWAGLAYLATIPLSLGYYTWFRALRLLPASTATIGSLLVPIIGVCLAALVLGEPLGIRQITALVLTVGGVALAART